MTGKKPHIWFAFGGWCCMNGAVVGLGKTPGQAFHNARGRKVLDSLFAMKGKPYQPVHHERFA